MSDLEIIEKLEAKLPRRLKRLENITWFSKGFMVDENEQVTHLSIFNMKLNSHFPDEIFQLRNLEYLDIRNNYIKSIPVEIGVLSELRYLDIRYNELTQLPDTFNSLTNMQKLYLGANQFIEVPVNIGNLSVLNLIDISENNIVNVKGQFFSLPSLANIYLNDNKIESFPFADIPADQIVEINLSGNLITDFPDNLSDKIKR